MAHLNRKGIHEEALSRLTEAGDGIRWTTLVKSIHAEHAETPINSIWGGTQNLFKTHPDILKISKGIYGLSGVVQTEPDNPKKEEAEKLFPSINATGESVSESDFYGPFADWLRDGLDEVNEAIVVGGNILKGKWNTPDVIGVLRPLSGDLIKFEPQIVSAELKIDPNQPIVAFGQAISHRLFSHKCYLVLPSSTSDDDIDRIVALSTVFGLGLVVFDLDKKNPNFTLVQRASLAQPDMVYVNQMAKKLADYDEKAFDRLF